MKLCSNCGKKTVIKLGRLKDGVPYQYHSCSCGEEFLDMKQLHEAAEIYRERKRNVAKLSRWGVSLGVRIPKELVQRYKLKEKTEVTFIPEEGSIRMIV
jgi:hypothetical protein